MTHTLTLRRGLILAGILYAILVVAMGALSIAHRPDAAEAARRHAGTALANMGPLDLLAAASDEPRRLKVAGIVRSAGGVCPVAVRAVLATRSADVDRWDVACSTGDRYTITVNARGGPHSTTATVCGSSITCYTLPM
jgi:hypothetical protein